MNFHELLNGIELVMHGHTIVHNLFFALTDNLKCCHLLFDGKNSWVLVRLTSLRILWDHRGEILSGLA